MVKIETTENFLKNFVWKRYLRKLQQSSPHPLAPSPDRRGGKTKMFKSILPSPLGRTAKAVRWDGGEGINIITVYYLIGRILSKYI